MLAIPPLTIGESYFFRDSGQFSLLRQRLIPELIERKSATRSLRIWRAGCSIGEEGWVYWDCARGRLTNGVHYRDRQRCLAAGMDGYVSKPIQVQVFLEAIANACAADRLA
jgi:CheR methyltransferase, SAM binding domain